MHIVIIGAGIAGLTAALTLRKNHHTITLLEKSTFHRETGAAVHIGANVSGLLAKLGIEDRHARANRCRGLLRIAPEDGRVQSQLDTETFAREWKDPWLMSHRVDLHEGLKREAMNENGEGPIPDLVLGARIEAIDAAAGKVVLDDGRVYVGDLIIGADGNKSQARREVAPDAQLIPWGATCYRWMTPMDKMLEDDDMRAIFGHQGYFGDVSSGGLRMIFYACRQNTMVNFVAFMPDELIEAKSGLSNKAKVQEAFTAFSPGVRKAIDLPDEMKAWELYDLMTLPHWHKDKLVLIGDAAHPFLPFAGQGAAIAIEDALSLGVIFPKDVQSKDIGGRLKLYEDIRFERANWVQETARINGREPSQRMTESSMREWVAKCHLYNVEEVSEGKLAEWLKQQQPVEMNGVIH